jgi:hypothetical protein
VQGRFTSPDSFFGRKTNPQTLNLYAYVLNNPLKWADPTGHSAQGSKKDPIKVGEIDHVEIADKLPEKKPGLLSRIWGGLKKIGSTVGTGLKLAGNAYFASGTPMGFESDLPAYIEHRTGINPGTVAAGVILPEVGGAVIAEGAVASEVAEGTAVVVDVLAESGVVATEEGGGFAFSQITSSAQFSDEGFFASKTIGQVANELRTGALSPSQLPVQFIEGEGTNLIVNTRSSLSLMRANIPPSQWTLLNMSPDVATQAKITARLLSNGLTRQGTPILRITGLGKAASSLR